MPNRIVREGIIDSSRMEDLVRDCGWGAEVFYRRLHQVVDDFGRFDARASVLRARCYPTVLDIVREADVQRWIAACVKAVLVRLYEVDGRAYLEVADFRQFARAKTSKFPDPPPEMQCERNADALHMRPYAETETKAQPPPTPRKRGEASEFPAGFIRFWDSAPKISRSRSSMDEAFSFWKRDKLEDRADELIARLLAWSKCSDWKRDGGRYIPGIHRWLKNRKWKSETDAGEAEEAAAQPMKRIVKT